MKKVFAIATFVVAGTGALGVGAALPSFNGSDTLFNVTTELVGPLSAIQAIPPRNTAPGPLCPAANGLLYLGGGSGVGETNMVNGTQDVAPMSRFLQGNPRFVNDAGTTVNPTVTCTIDGGGTTPGFPSQAAGIVIGLDGLSILASQTNGGSVVCNGSLTATACSVDAGADPTVGFAYDNAHTGGIANVTAAQRNAYSTSPTPVTVAGAPGAGTTTTVTFGYKNPAGMTDYTFFSWQDVLKVLYGGLVDTTFHSGDPEVGKNCASSVRLAIANNYGDFFESPSCTGGLTGDSRGPCRQIQHLFRRDDASGTTDVFQTLLGLTPNSSASANAVPAVLGTYALGADGMCNSLVNNTVVGTAINGTKAAPDAKAGPATTVGGAPAAGFGWAGSLHNGWPGSNPASAIPNDDQDYDPIRRPCIAGANPGSPGEQVCERGTFDALNTSITENANHTLTYACGGVNGQAAGTCPTTNPLTGAPETCVIGPATADPLGTGSLGIGGTPSALNGGQCWSTGSLGLLLPILATNVLGTTADAQNASLNDQYDVVTTAGTPQVSNGCCNSLTKINRCTSFTFVNPIRVLAIDNQAKGASGLCPNGDESATSGSCTVPADDSGNPNCLSASGTAQGLQNNNNGNQDEVGNSLGQYPDSLGGTQSTLIDSRAYNLYAYTPVGSVAAGFSYNVAVDDSGRPITGAFFRLHTSQSLLTGSRGSCPTTGTNPTGLDTTVCANPDATSQIGCLVQASPCSIGYAGRAAETVTGPGNTGTTPTCVAGGTGMKLQGIPDTASCVQQNFAYRLARKLYFNDMRGFANLVGVGGNQALELGLAQCEATSTTINTALNFEGFVTLPSTAPGGGAPYCEDFNEQQLCGAPSNNNACAANGAAGLPTLGTTCGNGVVEFGEDCDLGTAGTFDSLGNPSPLAGGAPSNGSVGSPCSKACRFTAL